MDYKLLRIWKLHDGFKIYNNFITIFFTSFYTIRTFAEVFGLSNQLQNDLLEKHLLDLLEK